jgi:hypothetical protein
MTSSRLIALVAIASVVCAVTGFAAGASTVRSHAPKPHAVAAPADAPASSPDVVVVGPTRARLDDEDKKELLALIHQELAAQRPAPAAPADKAAASDEAAELQLSNDGMKVYDSARSRIDEAVSRGTWTDSDRDALRTSLAQLPGPACVDAMRPLFVAINSGKVRVEGRPQLL